MLRKFLLNCTISCLLFSFSTSLMATEPQTLSRQIKTALQPSCLNAENTSIRVVSVPDGKEIFSYNSDEALLPASIQKVVTTAAALHYLGPEFRFTTDVRHTGKIEQGKIKGNLILKGGGDPTLNTERLWEIARKLRQSGITEITGNLIADVSYFDQYDRAPAWKVKRSQRAYDAKLSALSLNFNSVAVHVQPGDEVGDDLNVWLQPNPAYMQLMNLGKTTKNTRKNHKRKGIWAQRKSVLANQHLPIEVKGHLPVNASEQVFFLNVNNPAHYAIATFHGFLQQQGIRVRDKVHISHDKVASAMLYRYKSAPLSIILKELNTYSSNFMAEQVLKTLAAEKTKQAGSHENALSLVRQFLQQQDISLQNIHLTDGSGLSRKNRFTARAMTDLLVKTYPRFDIGPDFLSSLRVMGASGAHSRRLKKSPAKGRVRGKTGTLHQVSTLAGYIPDRSGKNLYAFAFFLNKNRCGYRGADKVEDAILHALFQQGKDGQPHPLRNPPILSSLIQ